jgi:hypothetical protein
MAGKEIDRRDTYKKNKKSFEMLKKASGDKIKKLDFDPVALGIVTKKKDGGSQSTGSFFGDLKKAISSGGSSKLTKTVKVKKGDTLSGIAKKNNTTISMLQKLNSGLKTAEGQKTMEFKGGGYEGDTLRVPDPQSFQKGRLAPVRTKKKKNPYEGQKKSDMKEMNRKIMSDKDLKKQQEKVRKTPDRNAKAGGTIKKMNMGGVMKARGGTFKGTF